MISLGRIKHLRWRLKQKRELNVFSLVRVFVGRTNNIARGLLGTFNFTGKLVNLSATKNTKWKQELPGTKRYQARLK